MTWPTKTDFVDGDVLTAAQVNNIGTNLNLADPTGITDGYVLTADGAGSMGWEAASGGGFVPVVASSIDYTGTSATLSATGLVTYTAVSSLSLNGIFTSTYTSYLVVCGPWTASASGGLRFRLRASGTDNTGATSYNYQILQAYMTTVAAAEYLTDQWTVTSINTTMNKTQLAYIHNPEVATNTTMRVVDQSVDGNSPRINDVSATHDQTTSYDGLTIYPSSGNITGIVTVYGIKK